MRILGVLGEGVVLVPVYPLSKKPIGTNWQRRTLDSMSDPVYLKSFTWKNIGVLLGNASGGLCTIDIDADADVEPFLARNPRLRETTRTKRVRGCNIWVKIDGDFPPSTTLPFGEWRADGNQTVIWGQAIDKKKGETEPTKYRFLNEAPPIRIRFDEIVFSDGIVFPERQTANTTQIRLNSESYVAESLHNCISTSLHNTEDIILGNITAKVEAQKALAAKHPKLAELYNKFIEPRFQAQAHTRNHIVVEAVPFLYRAVAAPFVLELVCHFYDCNRALFHDSPEQHMKEAKAMLEAVIKTYVESLSAGERKIYEALNEHEQGAFRICRDLALLPDPKREPFTFYMSFNQLGDRLGIFPAQAQRIMRQLAIYGLIKQLKKGTRREAGAPAEAGTYQWLLSPPQQTGAPKQ